VRLTVAPEVDVKRYKADVHDIEWYRDNVPCRSACPVNTDSGKYAQLIAERRYEEAFLVARSPNPLASVCGRVCAAPCEDACRRGVIDAPVTLRSLKRFVCERFGSESAEPDTYLKLLKEEEDAGAHRLWHLPHLRQEKRPSTEHRIAVVGSGPAGLACAHDLAIRGIGVTVFEGTGYTGGMMRLGIPEYRLPRGVIDREIASIQYLGAEIRLNQTVGPELTLQDLKAEGYDAVFLSVGAGLGGALNVPGSELDGVIKAVDYLLNVNQGYKVNLGQRVLVIGGGSVALDAARTAIREFYTPMEEIDAAAKAGEMTMAIDVARHAARGGAREIHVACLESMAELPAARTVQGAEELDTALTEGIKLHTSWGPQAILGEGAVRGIRLKECRRVFNDEGRFSPEFNEQNTMELEVDSVILAVGQKPDLSFIDDRDGVEVTPYGTIQIDPQTLATSAPGIYAGGDAAFGPRILIEAVANGKRAANSIAEFLGGQSRETRLSVTVEKLPIRDYLMPPAYEKLHRTHPDSIEADRRTGITEVELVYEEEEAVRQAERCLVCHTETVYDARLCVLCGRCVDVCPEECLKLVPLEQVEVEPLDQVLENVGLDGTGPLSAMLKDHERCIRCGLCARRCPTEAFTMEQLDFDETYAEG
jgi:formate dehydrogenase beta subunit